MTGIRTTPMDIEQWQKFDGLLTIKKTTSQHGDPAASSANNSSLQFAFKSQR